MFKLLYDKYFQIGIALSQKTSKIYEYMVDK